MNFWDLMGMPQFCSDKTLKTYLEGIKNKKPDVKNEIHQHLHLHGGEEQLNTLPPEKRVIDLLPNNSDSKAFNSRIKYEQAKLKTLLIEEKLKEINNRKII